MTKETKQRKRGRPRTTGGPITSVAFSSGVGKAFEDAKREHEKALAYTLTQSQFMAVLLQYFQQQKTKPS